MERAGTYRDKKVKPLFIQMKNKIAAMAAQVKELTKEVEKWKNKYQKTKQAYNSVQKELDDMRKDNQKLLEEKNMLQSVYGYDTNRITYVTERFYHHFMFFDKVNVSKRQTHIERT